MTATDGYSEVAVLSGPGPAQSEISGANVMDTFRPLCRTVELTYAYERQGLAKVDSAIKAETG